MNARWGPQYHDKVVKSLFIVVHMYMTMQFVSFANSQTWRTHLPIDWDEIIIRQLNIGRNKQRSQSQNPINFLWFMKHAILSKPNNRLRAYIRASLITGQISCRNLKIIKEMIVFESNIFDKWLIDSVIFW
jgi:hypothetical protein